MRRIARSASSRPRAQGRSDKYAVERGGRGGANQSRARQPRTEERRAGLKTLSRDVARPRRTPQAQPFLLSPVDRPMSTPTPRRSVVARLVERLGPPDPHAAIQSHRGRVLGGDFEIGPPQPRLVKPFEGL